MVSNYERFFCLHRLLCGCLSDSGSNLRENHLEPLQCLDGVWLIRRHENHVTALQAAYLANDADFHLTFEHMHKRIERYRVLSQALAFIERENGHVASRFLENLPPANGAVLVVDQLGDLRDFGSAKFFEFR
jgi:hypothetical protein